jgi:hypothetical protein
MTETTHTTMHRDHTLWASEIGLWRDDLRAWQQELGKAQTELVQLEKPLQITLTHYECMRRLYAFMSRNLSSRTRTRRV